MMISRLTTVFAFSMLVSATAFAGMLDTGATYDMMSESYTHSYEMEMDGMNITVSASDDWETYTIDFGEEVMIETVTMQTLSAMDVGDGGRWVVGGEIGTEKMHYMNVKTSVVTFDKVAFSDFAPTSIEFHRTQDPPASAPIPEPISLVLFPVGLGIVGWAARRRKES